MVAFLGSIFGILSSLFPEIIKAWNKKADQAHELAMFDLQLKAAESQHQYKMAEVQAEADIHESEALYKASEIKISGWKWVDGLVMLYQSSVRPTITYAFMLFYAIAKWGQYQYLVKQATPQVEALWKIFNSEDMALFSTIIGYWFGQRMVRYAMEKIGGGNVPRALKTFK